MRIEGIEKFAIENGYDGVKYLHKWRGYEVYKPYIEGDDIPIIGLPLVILVKGDFIRMSDPNESFEHLDYLIANNDD